MNLNLHILNSFKYSLIHFTDIWVEQDNKTFNYSPSCFCIHTMQAGGICSPSLFLGLPQIIEYLNIWPQVFISKT